LEFFFLKQDMLNMLWDHQHKGWGWININEYREFFFWGGGLIYTRANLLPVQEKYYLKR
jgi:hypothetical protein